MIGMDVIKLEYPLHWLVWSNDHKNLEQELSKQIHDIEKKDVRGRTPLMLAVTLGHLESARTLINFGADVNCENSQGWTIVQEAVATGDPELLHMVLERRDFQRFSNRMAGIPELLQRLKQAPDFYVEMKWEFTSWVPLVSRMCPSDTYKVYKQGSNVRIDTTLLGFDHTNWQRGSRSYIFQGHTIQMARVIRGSRTYLYKFHELQNGEEGATMMEIDHDTKQVYCEQMKVPNDSLGVLVPTEESVSHRLTTPIVTTYVDTDKISFERNKAGIWGWRSDKTEIVNGHECKVFGANNVELITKTRTEHLTEIDKALARSKNKSPLQNFLGIAEVEENQAAAVVDKEEYSHNTNPCNIKPEEYFDSGVNLESRDIGRPKEVNTKVQKFKATLWLCENYPLSFAEQILPIVDLMAISSSHFAKLKTFIQMQLPSGFPVKIEIPLFHVLNARITFGNIFAMDLPVEKVSHIEDEDRITCLVDESVFEIPPNYTQLGNEPEARRTFSMEEEDELLQFAIQQSLIEAGTEREEVDIWEALKAQKPSRPSTPNILVDEDRQLQKAIQASLTLYQQNLNCTNSVGASSTPDSDSELQMALMLSEQEQQEAELQKQNEEKMLEEILQLSLTEQ